MAELSISVIFDGVVQLSAFLLTAVVLFILLKISARGRFKPTYVRSIIVCGAMVVARLYMSHAGWGANIVAALGALFALSFLLLLELIKTPPLTGCLTAIAVVLLLMFMEQSAIRLSAAVFPNGPSFLAYMGLEFGPEAEVRLANTTHEPVRSPGKKAVVQPPDVPAESVATNRSSEVVSEAGTMVVSNTAAVEVVEHAAEELGPVVETPVPVADPPVPPEEPVEPPAEKVPPVKPIEPEAPKFIRISMHLGVAYVPSDEKVMHEWVAATQELKMKGFVSLGDEVVILRADGGVLKKGEVWAVDYAGYSYRFAVESIAQNRVSMRAAGREELQP